MLDAALLRFGDAAACFGIRHSVLGCGWAMRRRLWCSGAGPWLAAGARLSLRTSWDPPPEPSHLMRNGATSVRLHRSQATSPGWAATGRQTLIAPAASHGPAPLQRAAARSAVFWSSAVATQTWPGKIPGSTRASHVGRATKAQTTHHVLTTPELSAEPQLWPAGMASVGAVSGRGQSVAAAPK